MYSGMKYNGAEKIVFLKKFVKWHHADLPITTIVLLQILCDIHFFLQLLQYTWNVQSLFTQQIWFSNLFLFTSLNKKMNKIFKQQSQYSGLIWQKNVQIFYRPQAILYYGKFCSKKFPLKTNKGDFIFRIFLTEIFLKQITVGGKPKPSPACIAKQTEVQVDEKK